jgi:hypothetical protein
MRKEVIAVTGTSSEALARLGIFAGEWVVEGRFPSHQPPSNAGNTIIGAWEKGLGGAGWEHDFALTYRGAA